MVDMILVIKTEMTEINEDCQVIILTPIYHVDNAKQVTQ